MAAVARTFDLQAVGGAAASLARRVTAVRRVFFLEEFGATEAMWRDYFARRLGAAKDDRVRSEATLKFDVGWSEYIFQGYAGHVATAIFLTGIPDDPSSLPHA